MAIEILFLLLLAYLFLGPKELPGLARKAGKLMVQFNQAKADIKGKIEREMLDLEAENPPSSSANAARPDERSL
jgi:Sec-independent protein secretion pathway components